MKKTNTNKRPNLLNTLNYKLFILDNKKYINFIDKIMKKHDFLEQKQQNIIKVTYLDTAIKCKYTHEMFRINKNATIDFLNYQNLIKFDFNKKKLTPQIRIILNINIKNQQCYELIQIIVKLQSKFIASHNKQDLIYISHKEILKYHKRHFNTALISSNISTISHNTFYKNRYNQTFKLTYLLPKKHFILYIQCRYLLTQNQNMSDKELSDYLTNNRLLSPSKSQIFQMRKRYLIPNSKNRSDNIYLSYDKNYSKIYKLKYENIKEFSNISGVYELLNSKKIDYHYHTTHTIYIGSTNDIKRRLTSYISGFGHTELIRQYLKKNTIYFRFIITENYRNLERDILKAFFTTYGEYPKLNTYRVLE